MSPVATRASEHNSAARVKSWLGRHESLAKSFAGAGWWSVLAVKIRDVIRMIEDDGWEHVRQRGSHRQFKHPTKPGLVTIAGKPGDDVGPGTLNSVLKQSGLKP